LGTILANSQINIATFHLGRTKIGGDAIALIEVDEPVSQKTISALETISQVKSPQSIPEKLLIVCIADEQK
jgi:D-3-phosphoglycerate dehydrogenase